METTDLDATIDLVPGWDPSSCTSTRLSGGLTNQTYLVDTGNSRAVLRVVNYLDDPLAPDRDNELQVLRHAAAAGVAPAIIFSDPCEGILVTEYLDFPVWTESQLADTASIEKLAALLRVVHSLPRCEAATDHGAAARNYGEYLRHRNDYGEIVSRCIAVIENAEPPESLCCCHNDLVAANIVDSELLMLIDWEYAGDNCAYFDLASLICYHDLSEKTADALLRAYASEDIALAREKLVEQRRIFDALQWLWLACKLEAGGDVNLASRLDDLGARIV